MKKVGDCDVCGKPVMPSDEYQQGFFGDLAHIACLDTAHPDDEEER
jgi:hypothetical protein